MPKTTVPLDDVIGGIEAAELLGVDRGTLTRWMQLGQITPLKKVGARSYLFSRAAVLAFAEQRAAARQSGEPATGPPIAVGA